ncbi:hypothetical protein K2173_021996 [Erythroxylum novogranatense]|uniref:Uncharacterized protein n=1 Tax=Erythroxylum novogranatense TaxID=1862640 RepID=A0AAV8T419_9ROSI|nr:hypothetical protein K2173_021996 [Erythroxylum novogranatense]
MSVCLSMSLSCGDHSSDKKESEVDEPLIDAQTRENRQKGCNMEVYRHGVELNIEFEPVEHPVEPQDEDRPVKCPILPASSVINEKKMQEEKYTECLRNTPEIPSERVASVAEPPARALRKRHHNLTEGDLTVSNLTRIPPRRSLPSQKITVFQMLQQLDKFEN